MSTYLVAVVVSNFQSLDNNDGKHSYKIWSNPELIGQVPYSLSAMSKTIDFFETNLKIPYSLPKLEIVAMPEYIAVAMENWGLSLYRESLIFYDEAVTSLAVKRRIRTAITHELTHQWFGNLVTPERWDFLWLSEAFATYFEYHVPEDVSPATVI